MQIRILMRSLRMFAELLLLSCLHGPLASCLLWSYILRFLFVLVQVRSAFAMAFTTLTNAKAIFGLGPNRSILGTIIRPDEILVERKGGSNGEVTFTNLLPGAGEGLQQYTNQQEIYCNWRLDDDDEEALPRGNGIAEDGGAQSSGKKRKSSKEKISAKKVKENGESSNARDEGNSSRKEKSSKKHWKHNRW